MSWLFLRWDRWRDSTARDVTVALVWTAVVVGGSYGEAHPNNQVEGVVSGHRLPHTNDAALLLVAVAGLALAWRRRYPRAVLTLSAAAVVTYTLLGYVNGAALLAPTVALYSLASVSPARRAVAWAAGTLVLLMATTEAVNPLGTFGGGFELIPGEIVAALFLGIAVANRRAYIASLQQRGEEETRRRVDEERLRIARELHDVVVHTMATINVQAGVAAHLLPGQPETAEQALETIKRASKDGLRELRTILNLLRQADEAEPTQPAPGLRQIDALIATAESAGLPTTVTVRGKQRRLPAETDLAAYRIIQESLTNAIRHAGPATAAVTLSYTDRELELAVHDSGRGGRAATDGARGGHGLIGMRERAAALGGTLEAGRAADGGFRVRALLPIEAQQ